MDSRSVLVSPCGAEIFRASLQVLGWDVDDVDIDLVRGTARICLRCDDLRVIFDARDGRVSTTRERVETVIEKVGRRGDVFRAHRLHTRFVGRTRHEGIRSGLRWLADYVGANATRALPSSDARRIFAPLLALPPLTGEVDHG